MLLNFSVRPSDEIIIIKIIVSVVFSCSNDDMHASYDGMTDELIVSNRSIKDDFWMVCGTTAWRALHGQEFFIRRRDEFFADFVAICFEEPWSRPGACPVTMISDSWICVHTHVELTVAELESEHVMVNGTSALTLTRRSDISLETNITPLRIHCRQCSITQTRINGVVVEHDLRDYLGTPELPIVPASDTFKDLDAFDVRYRQKASAADQGELLIAFPKHLSDDSVVVTIDYELINPKLGFHSGYRGTLAEGSSGLGLLDPTGYDGPFWSDGSKPQHLYTFNEPMTSGSLFNGASGLRTWLPCIDHLHGNCTYDIEIHAGKGLVPVCSGALVSKEQHRQSDALTTFKFNIDTPIAPHALGFAIGKFVVVPDRHYPSRVTYFAPDWGIETTKMVKESTQFVAKAIYFFESTFDCQIPLKYQNFVFVNDPPADSPLIGAVYASMSILSRDVLIPSSMRCSKLVSDVDLAAEQAFGVVWNWFGILMRTERWQDSWLPLGLSMYMVDLFIRQIFGKDAYRLRLRQKMDQIETAAKERTLRPLVNTVNEHLFMIGARHSRSVVVARAAMTIHGIASRINMAGHQSFLSIMKQWLKEMGPMVLGRHMLCLPPAILKKLGPSRYSLGADQKSRPKGKCLDEKDFMSSIGFVRKLAFVSGCQLELDDKFIRQWLCNSGVPRFIAQYSYSSVKNQLDFTITEQTKTYEGSMGVQIFQGNNDDETHSVTMYNGQAKVKLDCKKRDRQRKGNHIRYVLLDPKMQLIHVLDDVKSVDPKSTAEEEDQEREDQEREVFLTEMLSSMKGGKGDSSTQLHAIKNLTKLPRSKPECRSPLDVRPCKALASCLNPIAPYTDTVREKAILAIAEWQNLHAPQNYTLPDKGGDTGGLVPATIWPRNPKVTSTSSTIQQRGTQRKANQRKKVIPKQYNLIPMQPPPSKVLPQKVNSGQATERGTGASINTSSMAYFDPWYGLHLLMATFKAYFFNTRDRESHIYRSFVLPNNTKSGSNESFRVTLVEALSSIRDRNLQPPCILRPFFSSLLDRCVDAEENEVKNSYYVAALLRALGKVSKSEDDTAKTMKLFDRFLHYQVILPCPYRGILVSILRGVADMESSGAKPVGFDFHWYAQFSTSPRVREAAHEAIIRVYLIGGLGDVWKTMNWLFARLCPADTAFEKSPRVRYAISEMLLNVVENGIADKAFTELFLANGEQPKLFVEKLWDLLNTYSWYDWRVREKLYFIYRAFFSYKVPDPIDGMQEDKEDGWAESLRPPSRKQQGKRTQCCLLARIRPKTQSPRVVGKDFPTPLLSPQLLNQHGASMDVPDFSLGIGAGSSAPSAVLPRADVGLQPMPSPKAGTKLRLSFVMKKRRRGDDESSDDDYES